MCKNYIVCNNTLDKLLQVYFAVIVLSIMFPLRKLCINCIVL